MNLAPVIQLNEVLEIMDRKTPVSIVYRTADVKRKTGGERKELNSVILHGQDWGNSIRTFSNPSAPADKDLTSVHIRLMLYFNGRRIIY